MSWWWFLVLIPALPVLVVISAALGTALWDAQMRRAHEREFGGEE